MTIITMEVVDILRTLLRWDLAFFRGYVSSWTNFIGEPVVGQEGRRDQDRELEENCPRRKDLKRCPPVVRVPTYSLPEPPAGDQDKEHREKSDTDRPPFANLII